MGLKTSIRNVLLGALLGTRFVARTSRRFRTLTITFDDGPCPTYTPIVLDVLKRHGVKATFFLIGAQAEQSPEVVKQILREGHEIGNHAYRHIKFADLNIKDQLNEIEQTDLLLTQYDGRNWHWFRPPQGRLPLRLFFALLQRRRRLAMWSYDSFDYQATSAATIVSRFRLKPIRNGDVILFHDDNEFCASALEQLLPQWLAQGYECKLLSQRADSKSQFDGH